MYSCDNLGNIVKQYREGKMAHAFLLETNDLKRCYDEVLKIVKIINCSNEYSDNCQNECNICDLINNNSLPSLIVINPDGATIKKNQILEMMQKFSTKPIYTKYNTYIVNHADCLNGSSGNTILKFLEEPKDNILGIFITDNKENVLLTIRSRCQVICCYYEEDENRINDEYLDNVKLYLNNIYKNKLDLLYNKTTISNWYKERTNYTTFFQSMLYYLKECLEDKRVDKLDFINNISKKNLINIIILVENVLKYLKSNGNVDLILDKFVIEMRNYYD